MEMWLLLVPTRLGGDGRLVLAAAAFEANSNSAQATSSSVRCKGLMPVVCGCKGG